MYGSYLKRDQYFTADLCILLDRLLIHCLYGEDLSESRVLMDHHYFISRARRTARLSRVLRLDAKFSAKAPAQNGGLFKPYRDKLWIETIPTW